MKDTKKKEKKRKINDWFDLLATQGPLKSLLQHHNSKSLVFFVLSLLYLPTLTSMH